MQPNITKSAMVDGLLIGLLLSVKFILSAQKLSFLALLALLISVFIIVALFRMAIRFRETQCNGVIKYRQAFHYVFLVYFYGSIISSFVLLIYTSFIDTNFLNLQFDILMKTYENLKIVIDDKSFKILESIYTVPAPYALLNVFAGMLGGLFWGLILAAFVKKEKSIFEK